MALIFPDDSSRFGLHAVVGKSECPELFLRGLFEANCRHGDADAYFLDGGPGFVALDTIDVIRKLGANLVHGESNYPEGHGKIEKLNQTVKADLLRNWDGRVDIAPDPRALELQPAAFHTRRGNDITASIEHRAAAALPPVCIRLAGDDSQPHLEVVGVVAKNSDESSTGVAPVDRVLCALRVAGQPLTRVALRSKVRRGRDRFVGSGRELELRRPLEGPACGTWG